MMTSMRICARSRTADGGTYPGEIDERISNDLLSPYRRVGKGFPPQNFNGHRHHKQNVEDQQGPPFRIPVQCSKKSWHVYPLLRDRRGRSPVVQADMKDFRVERGARKAPATIKLYASWT